MYVERRDLLNLRRLESRDYHLMAVPTDVLFVVPENARQGLELLDLDV